MNRFLAPKRTLIVANGEKPSLDFFNVYKKNADIVIALDGASDWLLDNGITPNVILGDLDSIQKIPENCTVINIADQDSNDLEKALKYCQLRGKNDVSILGAFGLRMDHVLTNFFAVSKFANSMRITMADERHCAFISPGDTVFFHNNRGSFISLFPLTTCGPILTEGLKYPLNNEILSQETRIGTLNLIEKDSAYLKCGSGSLLVFIENKS